MPPKNGAVSKSRKGIAKTVAAIIASRSIEKMLNLRIVIVLSLHVDCLLFWLK